MLNLVIIGLNHRTAELDLRQRASIPPHELQTVLQSLILLPCIEEGLIISTCNRVEIVAHVSDTDEAVQQLESFLCERTGLPASQLLPRLYRHAAEKAVSHVFRVAGSLDSMILGEAQILGQVKYSYGVAAQVSALGPRLNGLMQAAFRTAKRIRTETTIGEYSVSVSSAAVELARKIFGNLGTKSILIIGAGKMGELAIRHIARSGAKRIRVSNRSPETALRLAARFRGETVPFGDILKELVRSDIVIASTGSQEILIDHAAAQAAMKERRNEPIVFIDISVPRNVDPAVGSIDNAFYYDVDDLAAVVEANLEERRRESQQAEKIVEQEVEAYCSKIKSQDMGPVVVQLQDRIQEICRQELQRFMKRSGTRGEKETQELEWMVSRIANKIAHPLVTQLKSAPQSPPHQEAYLETIKRIFKL